MLSIWDEKLFFRFTGTRFKLSLLLRECDASVSDFRGWSHFLYRWLAKARLKGRPLDDPPQRPWQKTDPEKLKALVYEHPDYRLKDFASHFGCRFSSIKQAFKILKITRKKRLCGIKKGMKTSVVYFWSL